MLGYFIIIIHVNFPYNGIVVSGTSLKPISIGSPLLNLAVFHFNIYCYHLREIVD